MESGILLLLSIYLIIYMSFFFSQQAGMALASKHEDKFELVAVQPLRACLISRATVTITRC